MGPKGKGKGHDSVEEKVERRALWLSDKVFPDRRIDGEAVAAMQGVASGLGIARAMELLKDLEEKGEQIRNPSGYLKNAAKREGFGPPAEEPPAKARGKGSRAGDTGKVAKRVSWLNDKVFTHSPIDDRALQSLQEIDVRRAMELLKDAEEKGAGLRNPSSYLGKACSREGGTAIAVSAPPPPAKSGGKGWGSGGGGEHEKIDKRVAWLNRNVFAANPIDDEAVAAMKGMGAPRAMELFKELEEKSGVRNPSGYLKSAARREGFGPPDEPPPRAAAGKGGKGGKAAAGGGKGGAGGREAQRVQKRVDWLNKHSFSNNPIDADAVAVMTEVDLPVAMEIFKELEAKAGEVQNPSAYLISQVKKGGAKRKAPASAPAAKKEPAAKKAKVETKAKAVEGA